MKKTYRFQGATDELVRPIVIELAEKRGWSRSETIAKLLTRYALGFDDDKVRPRPKKRPPEGISGYLEEDLYKKALRRAKRDRVSLDYVIYTLAERDLKQ